MWQEYCLYLVGIISKWKGITHKGVDGTRPRTVDGSNYNTAAENLDNPGQIADNMIYGFGTELKRLIAVTPTYHTHAPNARAFLLFHAHWHGDIHQAVELAVALNAAGTDTTLHVFEGQGFEGHIQMLLRLGDPTYPATAVMDNWLKIHVPVIWTIQW